MDLVEFVSQHLKFDASQAAAIAREYRTLAGQIGMVLLVESHEDIEKMFVNSAETWTRVAEEMKERGL